MFSVSTLCATTVVLVVALLCTSFGSVAAHGGHNCHHGSLEGIWEPPIIVGEPVLTSSSSSSSSAGGATEQHHHHRTMKTQAIKWQKIRVAFNFTFLDPLLDVYFSNGKAKACSSVGQVLDIGGGSTAIDCLDGNGNPEWESNCKLKCRSEDILTSQKQSVLKQFVSRVENQLEMLLEVPEIGDGTYAIQSNPALENQCSGLNVPRYRADHDFTVYVTTRPLHHLGETLANAKPCVLEPDYNRPTMAHMNVAPATLGSNPDLDTVMIHELVHGLGFSPGMLSKMRHPSDPTKTYYDFDPVRYPTGPVKGDGIKGTGNNAVVNYTFLGPGKKLKIISPNVLSYGRQFFECDSLDGVEWENGGNSGSSTATHWEKRILYYEFMTSTQNVVKGIISGFTLAFLTDMGFYKANMTAAEPMEWGKKRGCTWVDNCTAWKDITPNYFCDKLPTTQGQVSMCGYNRKFNGLCNMVRAKEELPIPYRHFANPFDGGRSEFADHCPFVRPFNDESFIADCLSSTYISDVHQHNFGAQSGPSARCATTSTLNQAFDIEGGNPLSARCNKIACDATNTPHIRIGDEFFPCKQDGAMVELLFPLRHDRFARSKKIQGHPSFTSYTNYSYFGMVECGVGLKEMCENKQGIDDDLHREPAVKWPTIVSVYPAEAKLEGGEELTIKGTNLKTCEGIRFGGLYGSSVKHLDAEGNTLTVVSPAVPEDSYLGGIDSDGSGAADVQLWCNISDVCPEGCAVGYLVGKFNFTKPEEEDFSISSAFNDFITSTAGKAAGGGIGALLIIALLFVIKGAILDDGSKKKKEQEEREKQRQQQLQVPPSQQRGNPHGQRLDSNLL